MKYKIQASYNGICNKCNINYIAHKVIYNNRKSPVFINEDELKCSTTRCSKCFNIGKYTKVVINNCKYCDKPFFYKTSAKKYCSKSCSSKVFYSNRSDKTKEYYKDYYKEYRKKNPRSPYFTATCQICNNEFDTNRKNRKNCSVECSKESRRLLSKKQHKNRVRKKCLACQNPVKTASKYCSEACKPKKEPKRCKVCRVAINRINTYCPTHKPKYKPVKSIIYNKTCPTCDKVFTAKRKNAKYCKKKCKPSERARRRISNRKDTKYKPKSVKWSDFKEIELSRPSKNYELDHIIPLNHDLVCGLHVPWNLQWLTKTDNRKKSNSFDGTMENISWKNED